MPPAKKAAVTKKAAAPKPKGPAFPLPEGHYFSTPVVSRRSTSSGEAVRAIRRKVGAPAGTVFDDVTAQAVGKWQDAVGLPVTRVVDEATWNEMFVG